VTLTLSFPGIARHGLRLATEIHRRAYHDAGVEVHPGHDGSTFRMSTPHCLQGDRVFTGEFSGSGDDWELLVRQAFDQLAVPDMRSQYHKGCFHRRGKARYDLVFAVCAELVERHGWRLLDASPQSMPEALPFFEALGDGHLNGKPPRHLALTRHAAPVVVARSDGAALAGGRHVSLDRLWWRGHSVGPMADALEQAAKGSW
jgi:hypothetical protein